MNPKGTPKGFLMKTDRVQELIVSNRSDVMARSIPAVLLVGPDLFEQNSSWT